MTRLTILFLCALALVPQGSARDKKKTPDEIGVTDPGKGVNLYSPEREALLGREMALEVETESTLYYDPVVNEFVNRLAQNLVVNSDAKIPFKVKVIDSEEVNAFALPGGYLYVNTGLIMQAQNEAELAGVLAHEIAHVAARHAVKQATRADLLNYATLPLVFVGGFAGFALHGLATMAVPAGLMTFSRGMEAQADRLGLAYMYKAGYDPNAFVDFLERVETLEKKTPSGLARLLSTHPATNRRIRQAQKEIQNGLAPQPQYVLDTSEFQRVRSALIAEEQRRKNGLFVELTPHLLIRHPARSHTDERPVFGP